MTSFTLGSVSALGRALLTGETGFSPTNGALDVPASTAVNMTQGAILTVAGGLQGLDNAASLNGGGLVNVTSTGVLSGTDAITSSGTFTVVSVTDARTVSGKAAAQSLGGLGVVVWSADRRAG